MSREQEREARAQARASAEEFAMHCGALKTALVEQMFTREEMIEILKLVVQAGYTG